MKLKWDIPVSIVIHSATREELLHRTEFQYTKNFKCEFSFIGKDTVSTNNEETTYFMIVDKIEFQLTCLNDEINHLMKNNDYKRLLEIIGKLSNKVLKSIRVMGMAYYLHELDYKSEKPEYYLYKWKVRYEIKKDIWDDLVRIENPYDLFKFSRGEDKQSFVKVNYLKQIDTIVQGQEPPSEREFIVNALEYTTIGNFRLAVIESLIGLEIALNGYLSTYFEKKHAYKKKDINELLGTNLNLFTKVSGFLNLTLEKDVLKNVKIDEVRKVIEWRNKIMHKTGHLNDVPEDIITEYLESVLILVNILGTQQRKLLTEEIMIL